MEDVHDDEIRTKDLMHTILHDIPLRYQREIIGDMNGQYGVYSHWARHSRHAVPSGWCRMDRDVRRWSSAAPRSGHDVAGPDINLNFLELLRNLLRPT